MIFQCEYSAFFSCLFSLGATVSHSRCTRLICAVYPLCVAFVKSLLWPIPSFGIQRDPQSRLILLFESSAPLASVKSRITARRVHMQHYSSFHKSRPRRVPKQPSEHTRVKTSCTGCRDKKLRVRPKLQSRHLKLTYDPASVRQSEAVQFLL